MDSKENFLEENLITNLSSASQLQEYETAIKKLERKIRYLEHDREYINTLYENEVRLRDFNEREKERQYMYNQLLLDNCPSFLVVFNTALRYVIGTSKLLCDSFGFADQAELNDLRLRDLFKNTAPDKWITKIEADCLRVMEKRKIVNFSERLEHSSGEGMHLNINISPIVDKQDNLQGVLFLMHDVTEFLLTKDKAEAASKAKSYFLTSISHEIRTPMNAIRGLSNLLRTTTLSKIQKEYVKGILVASDSLLQIINDILDYAKMDAHKFKLNLQEYSPAELLTNVANATSLKAKTKGLAFITDIDPSLPASLLGDALRVKQMLANILDNAVKYTKKGHVKLCITYEKTGSDFILLCKVEDTGIGMKKGALETIFEPFAYTDSKKKHDIEGIGLGLTISQNLANAMKGKIEVESKFGQGSIFTLKIPQKICTEKPIAQLEEPEKKRVLLVGNDLISDSVANMLNKLFVAYGYIHEVDGLLPHLSKNTYTHVIYWHNMAEDLIKRHKPHLNNVSLICVKNLALATVQETGEGVKTLFEPILITRLVELLNNADPDTENDESHGIGIFKAANARALLVDDNEINLMVAEELLRHYDIAVDSAQSGQQAIELAKAHDYDIVFMDHMMPGMDGMETTAQLRKLGDWGETVPIIALTANAVLGVKEFFIENRLDDYLSKPIEIHQLNNILLKWLPKEKLDLGQTEVVQQEDCPADNDLVEQDGFLSRARQDCDLDVSSSLTLLGGKKEAYKALLEIFVSKAASNKNQLVNLYSQKDWQELRILVHGLKSAFYNIGAKFLSEFARKLELSLINKDYEYVNSSFSEFVLKMEELERQLTQLVEADKVKIEQKKAGAEDLLNLKEKLGELAILIELLEDEQALKNVDNLLLLSYNEEIDNLLVEVKKGIESFSYEEVNIALGKLSELL